MAVPEAATVIAMCGPPHGPGFTASRRPGSVPRTAVPQLAANTATRSAAVAWRRLSGSIGSLVGLPPVASAFRRKIGFRRKTDARRTGPRGRPFRSDGQRIVRLTVAFDAGCPALLPVIVSGWVTRWALPAALIVSVDVVPVTDAGLNAAVTPDGSPLTDSATAPAKPPLTVIVLLSPALLAL